MEPRYEVKFDEDVQGYYAEFYDYITMKDIVMKSGYRLATQCFDKKFQAVKQANRILRKIMQNDKFYASLWLDG